MRNRLVTAAIAAGLALGAVAISTAVSSSTEASKSKAPVSSVDYARYAR